MGRICLCLAKVRFFFYGADRGLKEFDVGIGKVRRDFGYVGGGIYFCMGLAGGRF